MAVTSLDEHRRRRAAREARPLAATDDDGSRTAGASLTSITVTHPPRGVTVRGGTVFITPPRAIA